MTTAVIIQARTGSSRFPSKVLADLGGRTVLAEVIRRCRNIVGADIVVCAIPDNARDDVIVNVAERAGAIVVRGSERDVLDRYARACEAVGASVVMRITADCPLLDPEICASVLRLRARESADFAANDIEPTFPRGLNCEVFTADALMEAAASATDPYDREHVTPWMQRAKRFKRVNLRSSDAALAGLRWTLDYPEDLDFVRAVFAASPSNEIRGMSDVLAVLARNPAIGKLNAMHDVNA